MVLVHTRKGRARHIHLVSICTLNCRWCLPIPTCKYKIQWDYNLTLHDWADYVYSTGRLFCVFLQIVRCPSLPCEISAPEECLWTDLMIEKQVYGRQANHYACIKRADNSCSWYRGVSSPKNEFLNGEEP